MHIYTLEEATAIILASAWRMPAERVALDAALLRALAADVRSDVAMPPFHKASMDGYACRRADAGAPLRVVEEIPAGAWPRRALSPGECAKIMTGAPLPEGADCVLVVEQTTRVDETHVRYTGTTVLANFCATGSDVQAGDVVLRAGRHLQPQDLAVLAAVGCTQVPVARQPQVGLLATGDEVIPAAETPAPAQIRNSNSHQLAALVRLAGGNPQDLGIARDDAATLEQAIAGAVESCDIVLSTGGVSMGDYDLVPGVLEALGFETKLRRVAIQPGKPIVFGVRGEKAFFGLSGNPVSSFVQFELLVRPFLAALQGVDPAPLELHLPVLETMRRKNADRMAWVPVRLETGGVRPVRFHGSAHAHALCHADGLVAYPVGVHDLQAGQRVAVRLCRWR